MTTTTQNLYNELSKLTDNAEQIEALLKVLPGQSYSEDDLRKIINDQKDEAFQQFKSLETKLELNQKAIELTIAELNPSLQSFIVKSFAGWIDGMARRRKMFGNGNGKPKKPWMPRFIPS